MAISFNYNYPKVTREAGFKLRQYKDGPIDWHILGSIEIDRLLQDQRIDQVDGLLSHLSEAPLAAMLDTNILDSGIAKYFVVSQFAIQYLLFCRKFLDETIRELREAHANSQMDVAKLRKSLAEANNEILQLHKKITQIEAIHEVVYPCHLCTKSFISNEALNIHISRRHAARVAVNAPNIGATVAASGNAAADRRTETPASAATREREHNDLQLINAVKLELEIKQLKERLNNAERDIRERSGAAPSHSRRATPREPPKWLKSVAIQSELLETKEQDDGADATLNSVSTDSSEVRERRAQLGKLQAKIQEFEAWRESQQANNEESIAEINRKLGEIVHTLEEAKTTTTTAFSVPVTGITSVEPRGDDRSERRAADDSVDAVAAALQRRGSPSVEDLERLLTEKVVEIGQKSAEKLEEFVHNMEVNYKEKLEELEREIKKRNAAELVTPVEAVDIVPSVKKASSLKDSTRDITYTAFNRTESDSSVSAGPRPEPAKRMPRIKRSSTLLAEPIAIQKTQRDADETYVINGNEDRQDSTAVKPKPRVRKIKSVESSAPNKKNTQGEELYSQSTESNRTFVKAEKLHDVAVRRKESGTAATGNDSTDITQTLSTESESDGSSSKSEVEPTPTEATRVKQRIKTKVPQKPKPCTRNDAQHLANKRLIASGLEPKTNGISTAAMKRLSAELSHKRHKLKQKYPNFYATRNKIKKLVDKLCSTKLPAPVEDMLKHAKPIKPKETYVVQRRRHEDVQLPSDVEGFEDLEVTSTPIQTPQSLCESNVFKQRLERILASPMRQPRFDHTILSDQQPTTVEVHATPRTGVPLPQTRKRVMFNTLAQNAAGNGARSDTEPLKPLTMD
ncbi:zinc finger protein DZIP1L-like [Rhagoletis pomonella]|uniref:zinc finger protein DZIP1L-like n=1 Tax=Rhagoletis pomonella TaxID=28610 RepID=UPI00178264A4|nr:zinc finger protein DZIP1L-like [Rhagoletis pomonella]